MSRQTKTPRLAHSVEHPTKACVCENAAHFPEMTMMDVVDGKQATGKLHGHSYGVEFYEHHISLVKTPWGTFTACPACVQGCLAEFEVVPSVLA
jgi:hypothetical protein